MKSQFNRNLFIGFGISLSLLIVSSIVSFTSIRNLLSSSGWVTHTYEVMNRLDRIMLRVREAESTQRGYMITGNEQFLEQYQRANADVQEYLAQTRTLVSDNPTAEKNSRLLQQAIERRMYQMQRLIDERRNGQAVQELDFETGKRLMDEVNTLIARMQQDEQGLLVQRTKRQDHFAGITPLIIVVASLLAIAITVFFYMRIRRDFEERLRLQQELQAKDEDIQRRISLIQQIAARISGGDYLVRVAEEGADGLAGLSGSLNRMAESLHHSFTELGDKERLQAAIAKLNTLIAGADGYEDFARTVLAFAASQTGSQTGAIYFLEHKTLMLEGAYGLNRAAMSPQLAPGHGLAGQAAESGTLMLVSGDGERRLDLEIAGGSVPAQSIVAVPLKRQDGNVTGVLELGAAGRYSPQAQLFLQEAAGHLGTSIYLMQNRKRLQALLQETQSQAEELQAQTEELQTQHEELGEMNRQLEMQAQQLQSSEEELKVQQEELMQANSELEERSALLEEKNEQISERNQQIQQKAEELEQSTKYKSEFLANMSHELRTPLNSILLLSRLLSENQPKNLSGEQVEFAQVINTSGTGLLNLIDEILDLSKIESGHMSAEIGRVHVESVVQNLNALFRPVARERGIGFAIQTGALVPPFLETDQQKLEQILKNLISNALKFTTQGSVDLEITTTEEEHPTVAFRVSDTGIGIPEESLALIFEAFKQADGSTRRKYGGTGLGLAISKQLAQLLGGDITVESETGRGSTFILTLPADLAAAAPEAPSAPAQPEPRKASAGIYHTQDIPEPVADDRDHLEPGERPVLIIEDDRAFARSLLEFTHSQGYKAVVAVRGDEGIELARSLQPAAIILDVVLPVRNGWEVMDALKQDKSTRSIPVHMMSSHQVKRESLLKGAIDFIHKPVAYEQMHDVFTRIRQALSSPAKKVLIVEENPKHARALAHYLESNRVEVQVTSSLEKSVESLVQERARCIILDMGIPDQHGYESLEQIKKNPGLENLPIIVFTGKSLSRKEADRLKIYADSIVIKTAQSYQRILDEVSLFLHLVDEEQGKAGTGNTQPAADNLLQGRKVLIADDDVRNIFSLTKVLEQHQVNVISAMDGQEALDVLRDNPDTDLVLMDVMMPTMDGFEAMRAIRKDGAMKGLPVIAVTAKAMIGDRQKCIEAGASDYISKPVDADQLLSLLRVWLYEKSV